MDFVLGKSRWHVIGYRNGNVYDWTTLCGWTPDEQAIGGNGVDVVLSEMAVCGNCDRAYSAAVDNATTERP